jgi:large repetitive protein
MRLKLALSVMTVLAALAVSGASAADFEGDNGTCRETPGEGALLRCPTAYVGVHYEIQIESEEGSGCEPYDWFEVVNSSLPAGLTMTRDGVISGVPAGGPGLTRFWLWNHDLTAAQGGPSWCQREDRSEREFSIPVDPGLTILNESVKPATLGQPYTDTLLAKRVETLDPLAGPDVQAAWTLESGTLPAGVTLSGSGLLTGTPTAEGSYGFVVRAQHEAPQTTKAFTLTVRQPLVVQSPFAPARRPTAEVGLRLAKTATATGGSGTYTWSLTSGALPPGLVLDPAKGAIAGVPQAAGNFAIGLTATDSEGRAATASSTLTVAPRLQIRTRRLAPAAIGDAYRAKLATNGGVKPLTWKLAGGKLPAGVRLSRTLGTLSGTPGRAGAHRVVVEARDALGVTARRALVLRANA